MQEVSYDRKFRIFPKKLGDEELEEVAGSGQHSVKANLNSISEKATEDKFWLQNQMEQKGQFQQMVSNIVKAKSPESGETTSNLKP